MTEKRRILFVDDEPHVLQGLSRMLRPLRHEWEMIFAPGGKQALEKLEAMPFDVVVTDMRMPGIDGTALLKEVSDRYPNTVRIVLSGHCDKEMVLRSVGLTHQFLAKPCDANTLKETVTRALTLRSLVTSDAHQRIAARVRTLPSMPAIFSELMSELQSEDASIDRIGKIISRDVGMTAKVLQLVNSAFFGLSRRVSNPAQAATLLGIETLRVLAMSVHLFSQFKQKSLSGLSLKKLWRHSIVTGAIARKIAIEENTPIRVVDDALMGGILHDLGKLVLSLNMPEMYLYAVEKSAQDSAPLWQSERTYLEVDHARMGAYLLGLWGLPVSIVEVLAFHHEPALCPEKSFSALTAVHAANAIEHRMNGNRQSAANVSVDEDYLAEIGLQNRWEHWDSHCRTTANEVDIL